MNGRDNRIITSLKALHNSLTQILTPQSNSANIRVQSLFLDNKTETEHPV